LARLQQKKTVVRTAPSVPVNTGGASMRPLTTTFKLKPVKISPSDFKYVGTMEPSIPDDRPLTSTEYGNMINWYNYVADTADARLWTEQLISAMPKRKHLVARYKRLADHHIPRSAGWVSRVVMRGGHITFTNMKYLIRCMRDVELRYQKSLVDDKPKVESKVPQLTIQDRMREKLSECIGELEVHVDAFFKGDCKGSVPAFNTLKEFNLHQNQVKDIVSWAQPKLDEMLELQAALAKKTRTDMEQQLVEGYSRLGKRQIKSTIDMWKSIVDTAASYGTVKKAERAPRKHKPVAPEKQVKKVKFLKKDPTLGIESIDPTKLVGATEVWIYNTKTHKIGIYVADNYSKVLTVKGAGLLGFSEKESRQKTLRKPEVQLKQFLGLGKPAARKWLEGIKSTDIKLNGRTNENTILLRAYK